MVPALVTATLIRITVATIWNAGIITDSNARVPCTIQLKLNADQEKAWKNYLAVVDANYNSWKPISRADIEKMTAPQRMQTMLDRMKEREGKMANQLSALKTFYNKLTPEQQKTFDNESLFNRGYHRGVAMAAMATEAVPARDKQPYSLLSFL